MKTKELIRLLQEADPEGQTECCVNNCDVSCVYSSPAYWDGKLQVLTRDARGRITGAKIVAEGSKIVIHTVSIEDAIAESPDLPVEFVGLSPEAIRRHAAELDEWRRDVRRINHEVERELFEQYLLKRLADCKCDEVLAAARKFFDERFTAGDPVPADILREMPMASPYERRCRQWDRQVAVERTGDGGFTLRRKT